MRSMPGGLFWSWRKRLHRLERIIIASFFSSRIFFLLQRAIVILRHRLALDVTKTLASAVAPMAQWVYSAMPVAKGTSTFLPVAKVTKNRFSDQLHLEIRFVSACDCNNHSSTCDVVSGLCTGCADNTYGDHCEFCLPGYYGDATASTPNDCSVCPCPGISNSFSNLCELTPGGPR